MPTAAGFAAIAVPLDLFTFAICGDEAVTQRFGDGIAATDVLGVALALAAQILILFAIGHLISAAIGKPWTGDE